MPDSREQKRARQALKRSDHQFRGEERAADSSARSAKRCDPDCRERDRKTNAAAQQARHSDPTKRRRENEISREQRKRIKQAADKVRLETPLRLKDGPKSIATAHGNKKREDYARLVSMPDEPARLLQEINKIASAAILLLSSRH